MNLVTVAYALATVAFALLSLALIIARRFAWPFNYLLSMSVMYVAWAGLMVVGVNAGLSPDWLVASDGLHAFAALLFMGQIIGRHAEGAWQRAFAYGPWLIPLLVAALIVSQTNANSLVIAFYMIIGFSLAGLLASEQIYRNAGVMKRKAASLIAFAFGLIFVFDLFVYSNALIGQAINAELWAARGFVNALAVPVLFLALRRDPNWQSGFFVSRQVVFYSTSLIGVGLYLVLVAFGGAIVQQLGGEWGTTLKIVFLVASFMGLALVVFSRGLRRRFKVFLATHFYANRYDYREEWLKLINRLAQDSSRAPMPVLCLEGLADIVDSDGGALWLQEASESTHYKLAASFGYQVTEPELPASHPLVRFMATTGWVVDGDEANRDPAHYNNALLEAHGLVTSEVLFVPLPLDDSLTGLVCLNRPTAMQSLNFEDHDLLRTVGRQLAVFLEQSRSQRELTQARQFDVFNRFSAFVMHDLKNLIAQQSLVVANAKKHKSNPAFVEDAISTIENSVRRMNRLLEQLETGKTGSTNRTVDIREVVADVCKEASDRMPKPDPVLPMHQKLPMFGDSEKLRTALQHLIRNAQDATPTSGSVTVLVEPQTSAADIAADKPAACRIILTDTGSGMSQEFIEQHLFEPFYSTKGAKGMGIGMYQSREYIHSLGGTLSVDSAPEAGTTMTIELPLTFALQRSTAEPGA